MREIELPPITSLPKDYEPIEKEIVKLFLDEIYAPLLAELDTTPRLLKNSFDDVADAIRSGRIMYHKGHFKGKFSSRVSKELREIGAKWDKRQGMFKIPLSSLPRGIRREIETSASVFESSIQKINEKLQSILPAKLAEKLKTENIFDTVLLRVDKAFRSTIQGITVAPKLSDKERAKIAGEYTENLQKYIVDWTDSEILSLRGRVEKQVLRGMRYEDIIKTIQKSYGVSYSKAKFLARQETGLMVAKFKETRYLDAGIEEYVWGCVVGSPGHEVRPMHKALEGKRFKWTEPPITDNNGNRNNPKEDFNCRCYAKPIVRFDK